MIPVNPNKIMEDVPKTVHLTWTNVGIGLLFLLLDATLSVFLELGLSMSIITAAIRCIVQLSVMVSFCGSSLEFLRFFELT
jgi:ABC-type iron transport system FetAB permease component